MSFPDSFPHSMPPESQSRQLDFKVRMQEMPYGYTTPPPAADTGDFDMESRESRKAYHHRNFHG